MDHCLLRNLSLYRAVLPAVLLNFADKWDRKEIHSTAALVKRVTLLSCSLQLAISLWLWIGHDPSESWGLRKSKRFMRWDRRLLIVDRIVGIQSFWNCWLVHIFPPWGSSCLLFAHNICKISWFISSKAAAVLHWPGASGNCTSVYWKLECQIEWNATWHGLHTWILFGGKETWPPLPFFCTVSSDVFAQRVALCAGSLGACNTPSPLHYYNCMWYSKGIWRCAFYFHLQH